MLIARWTATVLFIASVPLFLLLTNVRIAASEPRVFEYSFSQYDVPATSGIPRPELDRSAREIARYFQDDSELLAIEVTVDGQTQALFNPREVAHMRDVKDLFQGVFRLHEFAFAYAAGYVALVFLWSRERSMQRLARESVLAGLVTAGVMTAAALAMLVGFDQLFLQFHLFSFSNDFWQLNPATDHLVQMFPQGFWFDVSLAVGVLTVVQGGIVALIGFAYLRWSERRRGQPSAASTRLGAETAVRGFDA
ncbi:MAG: TIGR01906 family membrane protein [Dehalococcoidia bacterium]